VLDEATSALDGETEEAVVAAIEALAERKTLIVVAHRISTVRRCDRLLVLEAGQVAGLGPTEEVMKENEVLRRLLGRPEGRSAL
jgi:ABC-type multidrug transport system fused ATPase/permease subunit